MRLRVADIDDEIREIKKEIIESRGLVIKTSNLTSSLAADIKSIGKRQAGYERRFSLNGWVAYILFAVLSFAGLWLATQARVGEADSARQAAEARVAELQRELEQETSAAARRAHAEAQAAQFYRLIRERRRAEAVEQYPETRREELSPAEAAFFRDVIDRFQVELSVQAYHDGLELVRTGRYAEASESFREARRLDADGTHIPAVKLEQARALRHLGDLAGARELAAEVAEQTIDRELQDDGLILFAQCAETLGDLDEARAAYRTYLRRWPRGAYAVELRRHVADLNRRVMRGQVPLPQ